MLVRTLIGQGIPK